MISYSRAFLKRPLLAYRGARATFTSFDVQSSTRPSTSTRESKDELVRRLLLAKDASGKSFDEIAAHCGLTNTYVAQLFLNQAQLKEETSLKLIQAVPALSVEDVREMKKCPRRSYDANVLQDPSVFRLHEVVTHYGEAFRMLINEKCGDGIMSAIDFNCTVEKVKGSKGEDRIVVKMDGKFLPHTEQKTGV